MPTYEYACKACGEHLEVVQSFRDDPLKECPACNGELRKVFSPIGISFKGSGFYKTDSRSVSGAGRERSSDAGGKGDTPDKKPADGKGSGAPSSTGTSDAKASSGKKSANTSGDKKSSAAAS